MTTVVLIFAGFALTGILLTQCVEDRFLGVRRIWLFLASPVTLIVMAACVVWELVAGFRQWAMSTAGSEE